LFIIKSYVLLNLTFLLPHCGPCDNFCYLGHIKKLVDDDDDDGYNIKREIKIYIKKENYHSVQIHLI